MYHVTKVIHFCYGHRLLHYAGKCRYLHGHNGKVEIELAARRLDPRGMVKDFGEIKEKIHGWIDAHLDHKMLLRAADPALPALRALREPVYLMKDNPTAEAIARLIYDQTRRLGFPVVAVRLWETPSSFATYAPPRDAPPRRRRSPRRAARAS